MCGLVITGFAFSFSLLSITAARAQDQVTPAPQLRSFEELDGNGDGILTIDEYLVEYQQPGARLTFFLMDANADGVLSPDEWEQQGKDVPRLAKNLFRGADADSSGTVSEKELLSIRGVVSNDAWRQRLRIFDMDGDGELSYEEFLTLPGVIPAEQRGPIFDPFVEHVEDLISGVQSVVQWPVSAEGWPAVVGERLAAGIPSDVQHWDRNGDGVVDAAEFRLGLEIAYGVRRPDGEFARHPSGLVFNGSYFKHLDVNGDGMLSREEFVSRYVAGREKSLEIFLAADSDRDGRLTLTEIDGAGLLQIDVPAEFLKWDTDRDGFLSAEELSANAQSWERNLAEHLLPGFDLDGDGKLSLREFRASPLGNKLLNWDDLRVDRDHDGWLSRTEFFAVDQLYLSGMASLFFDRFDVNGDGRLSLEELGFEIDERHLPAERLVALRDRNGDGQLSLAELFTPIGLPLSEEAPEVLVPRHLQLFKEADRNGDGLLNSQELRSIPELTSAMIVELNLRKRMLPEFRKRDTNGDGKLSREEWLTGREMKDLAELQYEFLLCDFDGDGALSFLEFACAPSNGNASQRPDVPDPIREEADRVFAAIIQGLGSGSNSSLGGFVREHVAVAARQQLSFLTPDEVAGWDANRDGVLDVAEIRRGVDYQFGVRQNDGRLLRRPGGQVFNRRTFLQVDTNKDGVLSRAEFFPKYWKQGKAAEVDFQATDRNGNGQLSLPELLDGYVYWIDTLAEFKRLDRDRDGRISVEELAAGAKPHEASVASALFPAFDLDGDGGLSFREFRATPLANPLMDYCRDRWDRDHDGRLSLAEYHAEETPQFRALSHLFFSRFDQNQDGFLSFREVPFRFSLSKLAPEIAFSILDGNGDGRVSLKDIVAHYVPKDNSREAQLNHEKRLMQIEDAFHASDTNRDRVLTLSEFTTTDSAIAASIAGRNISSGASQAFTQNVASPSAVNWRFLGLIVFNGIVLVGLAWILWK